jgi:uncharacterized membrane protein
MGNILIYSVIAWFVLKDVKKQPSKQVEEICLHLTKEERAKSKRQMTRVYLAICLFLISSGIIGVFLSPNYFESTISGVYYALLSSIVFLIALFIIFKPFIRRFHQNFYASTQWAKEMKISSKKLKIYDSN